MIFLLFFGYTRSMILLYILLVAYILSVNFYSFLLVKSMRDKEKDFEREQELMQANQPVPTPSNPPRQGVGKLCVAGLVGGAITIYVSMFLLKYKRGDLLLMVLMPLLGVLNIYIFVLLFKSGFGFSIIR